MTRYLVSDVGVLTGRPVVSGAAQGYDGQLIVLHRELGDGRRGPCFRCLFPKSPRPEHTQSCDDGGILGAVTGLVGTWQALETIKLLTGLGDATPCMLLFSPLSMPPVRVARVRSRQASCRSCGDASVPHRITSAMDEDYTAFCGLQHPVAEVPSVEVSALCNTDALIVDVRPPQEYELARLPDSLRTLCH